MKKFFGLLIAAGILFAFSSCSKEYTCACTTTDSSGTIATATVETTAEFKKKADAEDWCNSETTAGTVTVKCELK